MVAKAATRAGEFFCFHCGKQVKDLENSCTSCGSVFDKVTEAFRCPRCSNLLPIGAAACPACGLGFKVRTISTSTKLSEDDKFLMKLIDWGKQGEAPPPKPQVIRSVKPSSTPPPPPPPTMNRKVASEPSKPAPSLKAQARAPVQVKEYPRNVVREIPKQAPRAAPVEKPRAAQEEISEEVEEEVLEERAKPPVIPKENATPAARLGEIDDADVDLDRVSASKANIPEAVRTKPESGEERASMSTNAPNAQPQASREETAISEVQIRQPIEAAEAKNIQLPTPPTPLVLDGDQEVRGLSNQALKKLLEEREKEVGDLKEREEELARKEEHLNRKIRAYAVKKKELDTLEKQYESRKAEETAEESEGQNFPSELVVDDKAQWLKEQSRIKSGLIEIRNEVSAKKSGMEYSRPQVSSDIAEKIEILEEKLDDVAKERDELASHIWKLEESKVDVIELLKVLDQLLGKLPPEIIDEFSKSKDFKLYEKVLDDLNI